MKAGALAMDVFKRNPNHPGATHYIIHAFDDPVHAPLGARRRASSTPRSSPPSRTPSTCRRTSSSSTACGTRSRTRTSARSTSRKDLWQPGDAPGRHGALGRLGPVRLPAARRLRRRARAHSRVRGDGRDDEASARGRRARAGQGALHHRDRGVEGAAGGRQRVERDDARQRHERGEDRRPGDGGEDGGDAGGQGRRPRRAAGGGGAHADHGAAPAPAAGGERSRRRQGRSRIMHRSSPRSSPRRRARGIRRSRCSREAVQIEESMRPPNGAADPIKPSHELLGEVLLRAGKARRGGGGVRRLPAAHAEPRALAAGRGARARRGRQRASSRRSATRR